MAQFFFFAVVGEGCARTCGSLRRTAENSASGQSDIFGALSETEPLRLPAAEPWLPAEKLHREFLAVGFYLSAHPLDEYKAELAKLRVQTHAEFAAAVKRGATAGRLAGSVTSFSTRRTRTGNQMGIAVFSDSSGQYEAVMFSETLAQYRDALGEGRPVVITVAAEDRPEGMSLRLQTVQPLEDWLPRPEIAAHLCARCRPAGAGPIAAIKTRRPAGVVRGAERQGRRRNRDRARQAAIRFPRRLPRRCAPFPA